MRRQLVQVEAESRRRGFAFIASDDVPPGAFYTVGWHMAATIERELGRERVVATLCDPLQLLRDYNRSVGRASRESTERIEPVPPTWSDSLLRRLGG